MLRKLMYSMVVMVVAIGFVAAESFDTTITKVDGNKVTYQKYKKSKKEKGGKAKAREKDDPVTLTVAKDAKIAIQDSRFGDLKVIEGGLKSETFTKIDTKKGLRVRLTTSDDKKSITAITILVATTQ